MGLARAHERTGTRPLIVLVAMALFVAIVGVATPARADTTTCNNVQSLASALGSSNVSADSSTINVTSTATANNPIVYTGPAATLNVESGATLTLNSLNGSSAADALTVSGATSSLTITGGGKITQSSSPQSNPTTDNVCVIKAKDGATLTINMQGGTIEAQTASSGVQHPAVACGYGTLDIQNGTLKSQGNTVWIDAPSGNNTSTVTISGGTITSTGYGASDTNSGNAVTNMGAASGNQNTLTISGGTITGKQNGVVNGGNLTVTGGKITATSTDSSLTSCGVYTQSNGNTTIEGTAEIGGGDCQYGVGTGAASGQADTPNTTVSVKSGTVTGTMAAVSNRYNPADGENDIVIGSEGGSGPELNGGVDSSSEGRGGKITVNSGHITGNVTNSGAGSVTLNGGSVTGRLENQGSGTVEWNKGTVSGGMDGTITFPPSTPDGSNTAQNLVSDAKISVVSAMASYANVTTNSNNSIWTVSAATDGGSTPLSTVGNNLIVPIIGALNRAGSTEIKSAQNDTLTVTPSATREQRQAFALQVLQAAVALPSGEESAQALSASPDPSTLSELAGKTCGIVASTDSGTLAYTFNFVGESSSEPVDKAALEEAISSAEDTYGDNADYTYTASSWLDYQQALKAAQDVIANTEATQTEVDDALTSLNSATGALTDLTQESGKADIETYLDKAEALTESEWTPESWEALQAAITEANQVLSAENPTNGELYSAASNLIETIDALVPETSEPAAPVPVYRLYNKYDYLHLYTSDENEIATLKDNGWTVDFEGEPCWYEPAEGSSEASYEVIRLYNPYNHGHYFVKASDAAQIDFLTGLGWEKDSTASSIWSAADTETNVEVYTLYNQYNTSDTHLYTANQTEVDTLVKPDGWELNTSIIWGVQPSETPATPEA